MSTQLVGVIAMAGLFGLILLRVPVAIAMGVTGFLGYAAIDGWDRALITAGSTPYDLTDKYSLTVVPLFILMGAVATRSGISNDLYRAANALFSGFRGALAMGTVGACAGFGAICGSSLATAATMTRVAVPQMRSYGYDERLATGVVASGGILGVLIPPSVVLVIYAIMAEEGVPQLFAAALFPGLALAFFPYSGYWRHGHLSAAPGSQKYGDWFALPSSRIAASVEDGDPVCDRRGWHLLRIHESDRSRRRRSFRCHCDRIHHPKSELERPCRLAPRNRLDHRNFVFHRHWRFSLFLFYGPDAAPQCPDDMGPGAGNRALGRDPDDGRILCFLGFFLDAISMILITVPVFLPLAEAVGYDGIWFGILVLVAVEVGMITPPVGLNIFVIRAQMPDIALRDVYWGIVPFLSAHFALIAVLLLIPSIALWLPNLLY